MRGLKRVGFISVVAALAVSVFEWSAVSAAPPAPPVKAGLWEVRMNSLDANGKEMPSPQQAMMARMSPEERARMAEAMKGRGLAMPDENGAMKVCLTRESFESGQWQQAAADSGCSTTYSSTNGSTWKWHTSCAALKAESDGESVFSNTESYRTKVTTTLTATGSPRTTTRVMQGKWLGADCGSIKPVTANGLGRQ